jgi:hypothetical protein
MKMEIAKREKKFRAHSLRAERKFRIVRRLMEIFAPLLAL